MTPVRARGVRVSLGGTPVLAGVDLSAEPGGWVCIVGPNGAGKSTAIRVLAGLLGHEGDVEVGTPGCGPLRGLSPRRRARLIAYAPQDPTLPPAITVAEYVMLGRTPHHGLLAAPRRADHAAVAEALHRLDLTTMAGRLLRTLSGGERQRAVLARALAQQPSLLLLDEPTAALDLGHAQQVLDLVDRLRREDGLTVISTLHDLTLAAQYADALVLLVAGRVVAAGPPALVLTAEALAVHYGARAEVVAGPAGPFVHPVRR